METQRDIAVTAESGAERPANAGSQPAQPAMFVDHPRLEALHEHMHRFDEKVKEVLDKFEASFARPAAEEERELLQRTADELIAIGQMERRLRGKTARRFLVRGHVEFMKSRVGAAIAEKAKAFVAETEALRIERTGEPYGAETPWQKRLREGLFQLRADLATAIDSLPLAVSVASSPDDWKQNDGDPPGLRLAKRFVRVRLALGARPPEFHIPLRSIAEHHLGALLLDGLEETVTAYGIRRLDALGRVRQQIGDAEKFFFTLISGLDDDSDEPVELQEFRESLRRELEKLVRSAKTSLERFEESIPRASQHLAERVRASLNGMVIDLDRADLAERQSWEKLTERAYRARRKIFQSIEESPWIWDLQHRAMAASLLLDLEVISLAIEVRRVVHQLIYRIKRDLETGPIAALAKAEQIMSEVEAKLVALGPQPSSSGSGPSLPAGPNGSSAIVPIGRTSVPPPPMSQTPDARTEVPMPALRDVFADAADRLRATWDQPYRPEVRELIEQLLNGLGRAAEKVPESVTTLSNESDLEAAYEGRPSRSRSTFPSRRLAQAYLEVTIAEPSRLELERLPVVVEQSQDVLVDACRLLAFELDHFLDDADGEALEDAELPNESGLIDTLRDRIERVAHARLELDTFGDMMAAEMLSATTRALESARSAVVGEASAPLERRGRAGEAIAERVEGMLDAARKNTATAFKTIVDKRIAGRRARAPALIERSIADEVLELREKLHPHPEVLAALPLVYRRIFGRAPLDSTDMVVGRNGQLATADRLINRWKAGASGPIAIVGEPRSGRTTLASIIARELLDDRVLIRVAAPPGGSCDPEELNLAVCSAISVREGRSAEGALRTMPPGAVVLIDDLGRWIERAPGGLAAFDLWMRMWDRLGDRHLFIITATVCSWSYLDDLVGASQRFLGLVPCTNLSRTELKDLLLLRQRTSGYELVFEEDAAARRSGRRAATRQLARIHERSRGNAGDALDLWRRSILGMSGNKTRVRIERDPDASALERLPLKWYAGLVAVLFHRVLTVARMARAMRMDREEALALLDDLERAGLLTSDRSGVWTMDPVLLPYVLRALKAKGMVP